MTMAMVKEQCQRQRKEQCKQFVADVESSYPLCDNPVCEEMWTCNMSAHMDDDSYYLETE